MGDLNSQIGQRNIEVLIVGKFSVEREMIGAGNLLDFVNNTT